jgi:membrane fusion protein, heavy metal efflux system
MRVLTMMFRNFILGMIGATLVSCGNDPEPAPEPEAESATDQTIVHLSREKQSFTGITLATTSAQTVKEILTFPGKVDYNQQRLAHLTSRVTGRVESVYAFLGDRVAANALLATIYSQDYLTAQAEFLQAEQRVVESSHRRDTSELATARGIRESARRKLFVMGATPEALQEIAETRIPKTLLEVRSPFAGSVTEQSEILGHVVTVGTTLFHVADISSLWVIADIFEKDLSRVRTGLPVLIEVAAFPGVKFTGRISRIFDMLDEKTRTVKARIEVLNPQGRLKPQMYATLRVATESPVKSIILPAAALQIEGSSRYVFVAINDTTFEKRVVQVGEDLGDAVAIVEGLKAGERIAAGGAFVLKSEMLKSTFGEE